MRYVGVDIGKWKCRAAMMNPDGAIVDEFTFPNDAEGIHDLASRLTPEDRVVMESTGSVWANLYNHLDERRIPVVLANPLKTRAIASARIKTDKVDAKILAHLLRGDLVAECYVPPRDLRELRALVRHRASLVRARTTVKNRVHSLIDGHGLRCGYSDMFGRGGAKWLRSLDLGALDNLMLRSHLEQVESLSRQVEEADEEIRGRASLDEDVRLLLSLTGVDVYTALLIRSEIGGIDRFPDYRRLVSWAGLAPSLHQSGSVEYSGRITKQGSRMLRWAMVEAARVAVRHDERMRAFYERVKRRRGDGKAVVAVACKMLKIIWFMLRRRVGVEVIPCVKTNTYGHGLAPVVAHMMTLGVKRFLVTKLWEAEQIRDAGLDCVVVSMDPLFSDEQYEAVVGRGITQTVYQRGTADRLSSAAEKLGAKAQVCIKIDTGLGRVGVKWSEAVELIEYVASLRSLEITGLFSTMSEDAELDRLQVERMRGVSGELDRLGVSYGTRSMASGNAVFHRPFTYLDAVRPGLMLYGFYPDPEDRESDLDLRQAFAFKARVEQVKWVDAGESLTYSRRFTAAKRMRVGTVHIGYSDGYPRGLTKKGLVKVEGRIRPVLGTVSVNHFLVDLDETSLDVGGVVEAIGREGDNDAHKTAEKAGIMTYSLMVGLNVMTPGVFFKGGFPRCGM